jgi:WD40 repeat protein
MADTTLPLRIEALATFTPTGTTRAWLSVPHPTAPILATASSDKTARIYSLTDFRLHSVVSGGHKRSVRAAAWKPGVKGESVLATGSFDASVGIWRRWETGLAEQGITGVRVQRDEDDSEEEEEEWRFSVLLDGHESEVKGVAFNAGGQYLATCSRDKTVWIWEEVEEDNFETIAVLQEHEADIKCVTWHPQEDLLASGSYDDTIRLYREDLDDWACVALLQGHESTVWGLDFEPVENRSWAGKHAKSLTPEQQKFAESRDKSGSRLLSCSDDKTIRIWQRRPKEFVPAPTGANRMPSIIRTNNIEEDWYEEARLPQVHDRGVYSISWSKISGRIVSAGSDGKVVVYEERWKDQTTSDAMEVDGGTQATPKTEWVVLAELDGGHGVYEVNNVCWTKRRDANKRSDDEEIIITTGDDGAVMAWTLEDPGQ